MIEAVANSLFVALAAYGAVGAAVAVVLHAGGLGRVDPAVSGAGWWFRALITPGLVALWPWMLARWRRPAKGSVHRPLSAGAIRRMHLGLAVALALVIPLLVVIGIVLRPGAAPPTDELKLIRASMPDEEG